MNRVNRCTACTAGIMCECGKLKKEKSKNVDHPTHYRANSGIEVIDVIEAWKLDFSLGNAIKYIARAGLKNDRDEDLEKARWYLMRAYDRETDPAHRVNILLAVEAVEEENKKL